MTHSLSDVSLALLKRLPAQATLSKGHKTQTLKSPIGSEFEREWQMWEFFEIPKTTVAHFPRQLRLEPIRPRLDQGWTVLLMLRYVHLGASAEVTCKQEPEERLPHFVEHL